MPVKGTVAGLGLAVALALPASAQEPVVEASVAQEDEDSEITLDWVHAAGNMHLTGSPIPVHIRLENPTGEDLDLVIEANWEGFEGLVERRLELAAGARKELDLYLGASRQLGMSLRKDDGEILDEVLLSSVAVPAERTVVGLLTPHPMGWGTLTRRDRKRNDASQVKVAHLVPANLPGLAESLRVFDILVWPQPKPWELTAEQLQALVHWVDAGGHLVLAVHDAEPRALRPWTEIRVRETLAVERLEAVSRWAGALSPRGDQGGETPKDFGDALAAAALQLGEPQQAWIRESWGVVAAREARGRGSVIVLGFDPSEPQLARWAWMTDFWRRLVERLGLDREKGSPSGRGYVAYESLDLRSIGRGLVSTNLSGPGLPLAALGVLLALYLVVIGPGEYLVLRRLDRLRLTWLTFPAWVLAFSLAAYTLVAGTRSAAQVRHILIRDLVEDSGSFCEELHAALFVTRSGSYRLMPRSPSALALPRTAGPDQRRVFFTTPDTTGDGRTIFDQGDAAIVKSLKKWGFLTGSFLDHTPTDGARVETDLRLEGERLVGRLESRLEVDLMAAWLIADLNGVPQRFELDALRRGEVREIDAFGGPLENVKWMSDRAWVTADSRLQDMVEILSLASSRRLVTTYRRGQIDDARTPYKWFLGSLEQDPHPHHDWSAHLRSGGLVLIGWAADGEKRFTVRDLETAYEGLVIYRVALPPLDSGISV